MNKSLRSIIALLLAVSLMLLPVSGLADAGGFSGDSDFGGSDWGSSDWGSSDWGSSDWGSSDWGSSDWGSSDDDWGSSSDDWGSSSSGGFFFGGDAGSSSGSGDDGITSYADGDRTDTYYDDGSGDGVYMIIGLVVIAAIIIFIIARKKRNTSYAPGAVATQAASLKPISELLAKDPEFSEAAFLEKIGNMYVQMQNAWQDKKFDAQRANFTDALYNQLVRQLDQLVQQKRTNYIERISVLGSRIMGWTEDDVNDTIIVRLQTRIVDYTVDDTTGKVVSGSNSTEKFMDYEWSLIRAKGVLTGAQTGTKQTNCNSCGAPVDINHSAKCEYCGAIITSSDYDWVISGMKGISQRSGR